MHLGGPADDGSSVLAPDPHRGDVTEPRRASVAGLHLNTHDLCSCPGITLPLQQAEINMTQKRHWDAIPFPNHL